MIIKINRSSRILLILVLLGTILSLSACSSLANRAWNRLARLADPPIISPDTDWDIFSSHKEWSAIEGDISFERSPSNVNSQSIRLQPEDQGIAEAYRPIRIRFSSPPRMRISVFFHGQPSKLSLQISSNRNFSSYFIVLIGEPYQALQPGWNTVDIYPPAWESIGGEEWSRTMRGLRIRSETPDGAVPADVSWENIIINHVGIAGVMLTFDDGHAAVYTKVFEYMKTVDARATAYIITNRIGDNPRYLTVEQLQEMDAAGWSIANHSHLHNTRLTDLEQAEVEAQLRDAREALERWEMPKAARHVAYPWGSWNSMVINAMENTGMLTGRNTVHRYQIVWPQDGTDYFLGTRMIGPETPLEGVKSWVDEAAFSNRIVVICLHDIVEFNPGNMQWRNDDLIALVDYIQALGLPLLTINDYHVLATGSILSMPDMYQTIVNEEFIVSGPGVLANDHSLENHSLIAKIVEPVPQDEGSLNLNIDGGFSYIPPDGWNGTTKFTYRSCNDAGLCSEPVVVEIIVSADL